MAQPRRAEKILSTVAKYPQHAALAARAVETGMSYSDFLGQLLAELSPNVTTQHKPSFEIGRSHSEKWREAAADLLLLKSGGGRLPGVMPQSERERREAAARECGSSIDSRQGLLAGIGRACLRAPIRGNDDFYARAVQMGSSDLPAVVYDALRKAIGSFYAMQPNTWRPLSRVRAAEDFRALNIVRLSDSPSLQLTRDLVPVSEGGVMDVRESYALATYSTSLSFGRQTIVSDDLSVFSSVAMAHAEACARLVNDLVINLLASASGVGPTMAEDSAALFATTHASGANYINGAGTCDVAGVGALSKLMRLQKSFLAGGEVATKHVVPRYLLVPAALESTARATAASFANVEAGADPAIVRNLDVIVEPRLDSATNGTSAFYLVADPNQCEGLEVAFLDGNPNPRVWQIDKPSMLGQTYCVLLDVGTAFINHRGWARCKGA